MTNNRLLWVSLLAVALYWAAAPFVPNPYLSIFWALMVLIAGTLTLAQYAKPTLRVVWFRERSQDEQGRGRGSHLAIYGTFLLALGCVFWGAYGLWWNYHGQPTSWTGSASSQFGRACIVAGFGLLMAGPSQRSAVFDIPGRWWVLVVSALTLVGVGFYLGLQVSSVEAAVRLGGL